MNTHKLLEPSSLERYSFLWSQARQVIAAVALLVGGVPVVFYFSFLMFLAPFLTLMWIVTGATSGYLLWRWHKGGQRVFGGTDMKDKVAFLISGITGINLGLAGLLSTNIGMSIASGRGIFLVTGILYLWTAWYLQKRWKENGQRLF